MSKPLPQPMSPGQFGLSRELELRASSGGLRYRRMSTAEIAVFIVNNSRRAILRRSWGAEAGLRDQRERHKGKRCVLNLRGIGWCPVEGCWMVHGYQAA